MAVTGTALATSLGINGGVCIVALLIFCILRVKPVTRKFYMPRRFDPEVKNKPKRLGLGLFSWISPVLFYPEDEMLTSAGMDVVVMVRLLSYGWVLFAFCTFFCCALLMPINGTAGFLRGVPQKSSNGTVLFSDLDLLSASNVPPANHRFWAHLIAVYVVTIVALMLLIGFSRDVSRLRARYMSTLPRGGTSHSVLVTDIPCVDGLGMEEGVAAKLVGTLSKKEKGGDGFKEEIVDAELGKTEGISHDGYAPVPDEVLDPWADARKALRNGTVDDMVHNEMATTYGPEKVAAVNVVYDTRKLDPLLNKYDTTKGKLEDITDDYIGKIRRKEEIKNRKQVSLLPALTPAWAKEKYSVGTKTVKVDALEYLPQELDHTYQQMKEEREKMKDAHMPAAFVTFSDRQSANSAATGLQTYDETAWRIMPAPGDDEVIWKNLAMRYKQRVTRSLIMWVVFIAILIFYLPVTAAIQAVVNLDNAKKIPGLNVLVGLPFVSQVLQGILPSLVLKIFLAIMPMILGIMARFEGKVSLSEVDFSVVSRYFIFQVFAAFIYQFLVGSAMNNIQGIVADPTGQVVNIMGVAAAQTSSFFMSFIMISALAVGMGLLRIVPLVIYFIRNKLAGTERAKYRLWAKQPFQFGPQVANHTLVMLLGLAFTVLAPLIAPFALLYFSLALLAQKYQLTYVVTLPYQAAGRMWMNCFNQIMVGIYFMQLMPLCVMLVKRFPYAILIVPLMLVTAVVHKVNVNLFHRPWTLMSLKEAAVLDARDHGAVSPAELEAVRLKYLSPVFKVDEAEHARLITQAGQVDKHLKGEASELQLDDMPEMTEEDC